MIRDYQTFHQITLVNRI